MVGHVWCPSTRQVLSTLLEIFSSTMAYWNSTNVAAMALVVPSMWMVMFYNQVSNEKMGPWLFRLCRGWKTTQLYEDFNKPIRCLGGGQLNYCLFSTRKLGKMNPFWRAYFSNGLVQPPTRGTVSFFSNFLCWGLRNVHPGPSPCRFFFCLLGMLDSYLKSMPYVLYPGYPIVIMIFKYGGNTRWYEDMFYSQGGSFAWYSSVLWTTQPKRKVSWCQLQQYSAFLHDWWKNSCTTWDV